MTELELLKAVRADEDLKSTLFLMVNADALQDNVNATFKAVVNNYIVKLFTAEVLNDKIAKILGKM